MTKFIALFRGINVGGHNRITMQALRDSFTNVGCTDVQTYIQSGNVTFQSRRRSASSIESILQEEILAAHDIDATLHVLTGTQWRSILDGNPFVDSKIDLKSIHAFVLKEKPSKPDLDKITKLQGATERSLLLGKAFYLYMPDGFGRSKLAKHVEKLLGVQATARNWRTMVTLDKMCNGSGS